MGMVGAGALRMLNAGGSFASNHFSEVEVAAHPRSADDQTRLGSNVKRVPVFGDDTKLLRAQHSHKQSPTPNSGR